MLQSTSPYAKNPLGELRSTFESCKVGDFLTEEKLFDRSPEFGFLGAKMAGAPTVWKIGSKIFLPINGNGDSTSISLYQRIK